MGESTAISWTHHTFQPWMGCAKVSPGCDHCYAEALGKRTGRVQWGEDGERVEMSDTVRDRLTGNGVVTPVAAWIAQRIATVHRDNPLRPT